MLCQALTPAAAGWNPDKKKPTSAEEVQATIESFLEQDPGLQKFFDSAHGYAVFPKIYKGAIGVGGAYGSGQVYEKGKHIGDASLALQAHSCMRKSHVAAQKLGLDIAD